MSAALLVSVGTVRAGAKGKKQQKEPAAKKINIRKILTGIVRSTIILQHD